MSELALMLRHVDTDWDERSRKTMQYEAFGTMRAQADYRPDPGASWVQLLARQAPDRPPAST